MTRKRWAVGAGIALYLSAGAVALCYLSGAVWMLANKMWPAGIEWDTWLSIYQQLDTYPEQRSRVWFALAAAIVLIYVFPPLIVAQALNQPRSLHGDARFARLDEMRSLGLLTSAPGVIVGRLGARYLIFPGQRFVLMAAPTRSGKGVGVVIPNLLNWPQSVVVTDIKGENFEKTSGFRKVHGQEVYRFAPFAEDGHTHRWNPFDGVSKDPGIRSGELLAIAQAIYPTGDLRDSFWNEQARNILLGLALYLLESPGRVCSFGELSREAAGRGRPVRDHLTAIIAEGQGRLSPTCLEALGRVVGMSDNTLSSAMATFTGPLIVYANALVDAATSATDFDIAMVRRRPMSIYVCIPPNRLADAAVLLNLFYSQLIAVNTQELPEHNAELKLKCLLLMDEFTAAGRLAILAKSVGYLAGYNLRLVTVVQSVAQLRGVYGDQDARTLQSNHALQIVFAPRELSDAQEYSEALGYTTEERETKGLSRSYHGPMGGSRGVTENTNRSDQRRALMLPQELRELEPSKEIIFLEGARPICCDKVRYYDDPVFMARLYEPVVIPALASGSHPGADAFPHYDRQNITAAQTEQILDYALAGRGEFAGPSAPLQALLPERPGVAGVAGATFGHDQPMWETDLLKQSELIRHQRLDRLERYDQIRQAQESAQGQEA